LILSIYNVSEEGLSINLIFKL